MILIMLKIGLTRGRGYVGDWFNEREKVCRRLVWLVEGMLEIGLAGFEGMATGPCRVPVVMSFFNQIKIKSTLNINV